MRYELQKFVPIPLTNVFSMHFLRTYDRSQNLLERLQLLVTDTNGLLHLFDDELNTQNVDMKPHLDEERVEDFSLELICADFCHLESEQEDDLFAYLATCWLFYDDLFRPKRYIIVFFRINYELEFERMFKASLEFAPTFTRLSYKNDQLYWLIFGHASNVHCYELTLNAMSRVQSIGRMDQFVDKFPAFSPKGIYGSLIRFDQLIIGDYNFELSGFDTGYLVVNASLVSSGKLLDRKLIKYNTPVAIAKFAEPDFIDHELFILLSSTIGPASVWSAKFDVNRGKLSWQSRCHLLESDKNDCVLTASITDSTILIGTYAEQVLFYSLKDSFCYHELQPYTQINIGTPVHSIASNFDVDDNLTILSLKGIQRYNCIFDEDSESTNNMLNSSNSSSPISIYNLASD